jgi:hypothetical protein
MIRKFATAAALGALLPIAMACQSDGGEGPATVEAKATTTSSPETSTAAPGGSSMIRVSLQNVAGDLAAQLNVERTAIPADAQASLELAAGVCGVSAKILATPTGEQAACAAKTISAELAQLVQQQLAAGAPASTGTTPPAATPN